MSRHPLKIRFIDGQHETRCLNITRPCILEGFTMRNGVGDGYGGGIHIESTPVYCSTVDYYHVPTVKNCNIENNRANNILTGVGGGIYDTGSNTRFENCTFQGNTAGEGGGVCHDRSSTIFEKCIFRENQATDVGGGAVAGYYSNEDTGGFIKIINCLFLDNESSDRGGAIRYHQLSPRIWNSTFFGNNAALSGGAFYSTYWLKGPRVRNSIFWGNSPDQNWNAD